MLNAGKAKIQGIEVDITALIFEGMTLTGGYGYLDPKYKSVIDFKGNDVTTQFHFPNAPKNSFSLAADYASPETPIGKFAVNVNYAWQGRYFSVGNNARYTVRPNGLLGARIGLSDIPGVDGFKLALWGRNLTNEVYYRAHFPAGGPSAIFGEPRSYGLDASIEF